MKCNDEDLMNNINCGCENCTPVLDDIIKTNKFKLTPVLLDRIYNCTSLVNYEYNQPSVFGFEVDGSDYIYPNNGKVTIKTLSLSYDNVGLPLSNTNSTEVYYNGKIKEFTPVNLTTVYFEGVPFYLFNELMITNTQPICCCNNEKADGTLISLSQKNQIFVLSNLKIQVYGCIDNLPFSAVSQFDILSTSQTLGFSLFNINSKLCWPESLKNGSIVLRYNPALYADTICPVTNYSSSTTPDTNGIFYAVVNLLLTNNILVDISNNEQIPILTNNTDNSIKKIN